MCVALADSRSRWRLAANQVGARERPYLFFAALLERDDFAVVEPFFFEAAFWLIAAFLAGLFLAALFLPVFAFFELLVFLGFGGGLLAVQSPSSTTLRLVILIGVNE